MIMNNNIILEHSSIHQLTRTCEIPSKKQDIFKSHQRKPSSDPSFRILPCAMDHVPSVAIKNPTLLQKPQIKKFGTQKKLHKMKTPHKMQIILYQGLEI